MQAIQDHTSESSNGPVSFNYDMYRITLRVPIASHKQCQEHQRPGSYLCRVTQSYSILAANQSPRAKFQTSRLVVLLPSRIVTVSSGIFPHHPIPQDLQRMHHRTTTPIVCYCSLPYIISGYMATLRSEDALVLSNYYNTPVASP